MKKDIVDERTQREAAQENLLKNVLPSTVQKLRGNSIYIASILNNADQQGEDLTKHFLFVWYYSNRTHIEGISADIGEVKKSLDGEKAFAREITGIYYRFIVVQHLSRRLIDSSHLYL